MHVSRPQTMKCMVDSETIKDTNDLAGRIIRDSRDFAFGSGGHAEVYVGYLSQEDGSRMKIAIKISRTGHNEAEISHYRRVLNREIVVWRKLHHRNVLPFLGIASDFERNGFPALISPFCNNGTVVSYLKHHPETNRTFMILNVMEGLIYLHDHNVVHGDLKPDNVLIDDRGIPVVCDFGCSQIRFQRGFTTDSVAGSIRYQARELLEPDDKSVVRATTASDIYSFGMTCYEIWSGRPPYGTVTSNNVSLLMQILFHHKLPEYPEPAPPGTENIWPILNKCWAMDPSLRPTSMEVRRLFHAISHALSPKEVSVPASTAINTTQREDIQIIEEEVVKSTPLPTPIHPVLIPELETPEEHLPPPPSPPHQSLLKSFITRMLSEN